MYYDMEKSGSRIRRLRLLKGYTQEELAGILNKDRSFLSAIETGKKGCSVDMLVELSGVFNVSLDYLILGRTRTDSETEKMKADISTLIDRLEKFRQML